MKKLAVAVIALVALTGCLPQMNGGGWAWDPSPAQPILIEDTPPTFAPGASTYAAVRINATAGAGIFAVLPAGTPGTHIEFRQMTPICPFGDAACTSRRHMWTDYESHRVGGYVTHCVIYYDPTAWWITPIGWDGDTVGHELLHCLDYPDVHPPTDYHGALDNGGFYDAGWRAATWWGPDDRAILTRDGYGP